MNDEAEHDHMCLILRVRVNSSWKGVHVVFENEEQFKRSFESQLAVASESMITLLRSLGNLR